MRDRYNREPLRYVVISFLLGVVSAALALGIQMATMKPVKAITGGGLPYIFVLAYIIVAFSEEFSKFLMLRFYAYRKKSFDEPFDGIVYSVMVSMGFATIENIGYVYNYGIGTGILRMFLSVPAHASFAVLMGFHVGMAKFNPATRQEHFVKGLLLAVFFHGTYDCFLFLSENHMLTRYISGGVLVLGALVSYFIAIRLSLRAIRQHQQSSKQNHLRAVNPGSSLRVRKAGVIDIPVIRELAHRIWPAAYRTILSDEQLAYMLELIYSQTSLERQMQEEQHQFLLLLQNEAPCGFADYGPTAIPGQYKLHKLYVLTDEHGRGLGRQLLQYVEAKAKEQGAVQLILNVNRHNTAVHFYEKMGYAIRETVDVNIGHGYYMNDYVMGKML
jgi:RsiW-degrading membrane proteinase PrsW (M82 family)/GNAT superfamily N-acetyltransferase